MLVIVGSGVIEPRSIMKLFGNSESKKRNLLFLESSLKSFVQQTQTLLFFGVVSKSTSNASSTTISTTSTWKRESVDTTLKSMASANGAPPNQTKFSNPNHQFSTHHRKALMIRLKSTSHQHQPHTSESREMRMTKKEKKQEGNDQVIIFN